MIKKFENFIPFDNDKTNNPEKDIIHKYHSEFLKRYSELKEMKLSSDYYQGKNIWNYSYNKNDDKSNIDFTIDIEKGDYWDVNFEFSEQFTNDYNINDEKHYEKKNLSWEELNYELNKITKWLKLSVKSFKIYESVNETLTKSYSSLKIFKYLESLGLTWYKDFYSPNGLSNMIIEISYENFHLIKNILNKLENFFGWFLSYIRIEGEINNNIKDINLDEMEEYLQEDEDNKVSFSFEPKYDDEVKVPDIIYHITDEKNVNKIMKLGLIPKTKSKISYHPERIYLLTDKKDINGLISHSKFTIDEPILLTIDVSKLKNKMKFYIDVQYPAGIYTLNNIPKECIIKYEKI